LTHIAVVGADGTWAKRANKSAWVTRRDSNPGIPDHFLNPVSRDWRCFNPGISGLRKTNKMPKFYMKFARKNTIFPNFGGQIPALKLRVSELDPKTKCLIKVDTVSFYGCNRAK